jgi:hypothetical protein
VTRQLDSLRIKLGRKSDSQQAAAAASYSSSSTGLLFEAARDGRNLMDFERAQY